jgi:hypothetical protein
MNVRTSVHRFLHLGGLLFVLAALCAPSTLADEGYPPMRAIHLTGAMEGRTAAATVP